MKKFVAIILAVIMVLSICACGKDEKKSENNTNPTSNSQKKDDDKKEDNKKEEQSAGPEAEHGFNLPVNLKIKNTNGTVYKIGNDYMVESYGSYDFYRYIGNGEYDAYYYDNGGFQYGGGTVVFDSISGISEYSFIKSDYTKTDETKEIAGKICVKYTSKSEDVWVYEEAGICFEVWFSGATKAAREVKEYDTSVTEFPVPAPSK